ncbi:hypothetical protein [Nitrospira tepida]|nr:hypothetical protein [Nitrospira tepida]
MVDDVVGAEEAVGKNVREAGLAGEITIGIWLDESLVIITLQ